MELDAPFMVLDGEGASALQLRQEFCYQIVLWTLSPHSVSVFARRNTLQTLVQSTYLSLV
jgi:hypothetical protein